TVELKSLVLAQPLIREEKKCFVLNDGATQMATELVALEGRWMIGVKVEEVTCIEHVVAQELEQLGVEIVSTGSRSNVNNRPGALPVFGTQGRVINSLLLHRVDRGLEADRTVGQIVQGNTVHQVINCFLAIAGGVDR